MNTELIKALKEDAEWAHANEWETPITLGDLLDAAADALESLQTQLAAERVKYAELQRYNADCTKQFGMLQMDKVNLQNLLAESQRRERAAVKDIVTMAECKLLGTCTFCAHRNTPDTRYSPCKGCIQLNRSCLHFEWRGPQAGEGETE